MEGPTLAHWSAPVMKPATLVPVESCGWRKRFTSPSGLPRASETPERTHRHRPETGMGAASNVPIARPSNRYGKPIATPG
jgi:hypothetical protein